MLPMSYIVWSVIVIEFPLLYLTIYNVIILWFHTACGICHVPPMLIGESVLAKSG